MIVAPIFPLNRSITCAEIEPENCTFFTRNDGLHRPIEASAGNGSDDSLLVLFEFPPSGVPDRPTSRCSVGASAPPTEATTSPDPKPPRSYFPVHLVDIPATSSETDGLGFSGEAGKDRDDKPVTWKLVQCILSMLMVNNSSLKEVLGSEIFAFHSQHWRALYREFFSSHPGPSSSNSRGVPCSLIMSLESSDSR